MRSSRLALVALLVGAVATAQTEGNKPIASKGLKVSATNGGWTTSFLRQQCIDFTEVKRGDKPDDVRDCRVSEFGEFGSVDEVHYYYALYCLIPNYAPDQGRCNDDSFNAHYHRTRGLAVFVDDPSGPNVRLFLGRVANEIGTLNYDPCPLVFARPPAIENRGYRKLFSSPLERVVAISLVCRCGFAAPAGSRATRKQRCLEGSSSFGRDREQRTDEEFRRLAGLRRHTRESFDRFLPEVREAVRRSRRSLGPGTRTSST